VSGSTVGSPTDLGFVTKGKKGEIGRFTYRIASSEQREKPLTEEGSGAGQSSSSAGGEGGTSSGSPVQEAAPATRSGTRFQKGRKELSTIMEVLAKRLAKSKFGQIS